MSEEEKIIPETISPEEEARMINVAKVRVIFKIHIAVFLVLNLIIWALWFTLFDAVVTDAYTSNIILKVSLCITIVWLLIVILHYCIAYKWSRTFIEKELCGERIVQTQKTARQTTGRNRENQNQNRRNKTATNR